MLRSIHLPRILYCKYQWLTFVIIYIINDHSIKVFSNKSIAFIINLILNINSQLIVMESVKDITNFEVQEFNKIRETFPIDKSIEQLWKNYYAQYRTHLSSIQTEKVQLHLKCAYFLAQKSTWITTINGQRIRNISISLSQLLKNNVLQQIMFTLKDYSNKVKFKDQNTLQDLQKTIKQISFMITFYGKFQKIIAKLQIREKDQTQNSYTQTLIQFIWLMFIQCKTQILKRSLQLIDNTCMLAHTMSFMLIYSWDYYQSPYLMKQKNISKSSTKKQVNYGIKQKILQLFLIKNIDNYKFIAGQFQKYFHHLLQKPIIKMNNGKNNFLSPEMINLNYKRLDHYYQKKLDTSYLDQRLFFKDGIVANITPFKFTPFNRQKINININKMKLGSNFQNNQNKNNYTISYNSHRALTFQNMQNQQCQSENNPIDIKLPKTIMPSPSVMKTTLLQQTPYTNGMQNYNYVNQLSNLIKKGKYPHRQSDQIVFDLIDKVLAQKCKGYMAQKIQINKKLIFSVYKPLYETFISQNIGDSQSKSIMISFLLFSIQMVLFASNTQIQFIEIQSYFQSFLNPLDEWRACDFFIKFDKIMPINIKVHFLDIQVDLISQKIWKQQKIVENLAEFYKNNSQFDSIYNKLGRRLLHQIAFQITQVCKQCLLCEKCQQQEPIKHCPECKRIEESIAQDSFQIMKQTLLHKIQILANHCLDQIILCTIYTICKLQQYPIKFNALVGAYKRCNQHNAEKHNDIIHCIQTCKNKTVDIIGYYNEYFVPQMKQFIKIKSHPMSRPQTKRAMKNVSNTLMQNPLHAIIPRQLANKNYSQGFKGANLLGTKNNNVTPRLYAYNESPLIKNQFLSMRTPINSKKTLFQQDEQIQKVCHTLVVEQNQNNYQDNLQTNNYLKKFTMKSPVLIKSPVVQKSTILNRSPINLLTNNSNQTVVKEFHSQSYHSGVILKKNILNQ